MYKHTCIHTHNEIISSGLTMLPPRVKDHLNKTHHHAWEPSSELFFRVAQETPQTLQAIANALGYHPQGRKQVSIAEDTLYFRHRVQGSLRWNSLLPEDSLLWYQGVMTCKFPKEGGDQLSYPAMMSVNHNNQCVTICLRVQEGTHTLVITNSSLTGLKASSTRVSSSMGLET